MHAIAGLPLAALFEEIDALETLQDVAFHDEAGDALEAFVLGHGCKKGLSGVRKGQGVAFAIAHDKYFSPTCSARTTTHSGVAYGWVACSQASSAGC